MFISFASIDGEKSRAATRKSFSLKKKKIVSVPQANIHFMISMSSNEDVNVRVDADDDDDDVKDS